MSTCEWVCIVGHVKQLMKCNLCRLFTLTRDQWQSYGEGGSPDPSHFSNGDSSNSHKNAIKIGVLGDGRA